jgi:hypothetical protein
MATVDSSFRGIVLDATARGVMLSDRGKYANFTWVMGVLAIIAGAVFLSDGGSGIEISLYLFAGGGLVTFCGLLARHILRRREASRRHEPRALQGLVVADGEMTWATCLARVDEVQSDSHRITDLSVLTSVPAKAGPAIVRILVVPLEGGQQHHIKRLSFQRGEVLIGEVTTQESGMFYILAGAELRGTPLPIRSEAEQHDPSRTCVRNLRRVAEAVSSRQDLAVRLAIAYPKEGVMKWGLMLGLVGGIIAMGFDHAARTKLENLLAEGGLRDSEGSLLDLVERSGWQMELV